MGFRMLEKNLTSEGQRSNPKNFGVEYLENGARRKVSIKDFNVKRLKKTSR